MNAVCLFRTRVVSCYVARFADWLNFEVMRRLVPQMMIVFMPVAFPCPNVTAIYAWKGRRLRY